MAASTTPASTATGQTRRACGDVDCGSPARQPIRVAEVDCDLSAAFLAASADHFPHAAVTEDWFHVVQIFTTAIEKTRRAEPNHRTLPKGGLGPH